MPDLVHSAEVLATVALVLVLVHALLPAVHVGALSAQVAAGRASGRQIVQLLRVWELKWSVQRILTLFFFLASV